MRRTFLIISQVYVPDPASVGQHLHDVAATLVARGNRVVVYTSARGYDDPSRTYPGREARDGVDIRRLPLSSFGKRTLLLRLIGGTVFLLQAIVRGALTPGLRDVLVSTSPPMCALAGLALRIVRRVSLSFWLMDVNPDQAVVTGRVGERSVPARVLDRINRAAVAASDCAVLLDRFMERRMRERWPSRGRRPIIPPWPHEDHLENVAHGANPFRHEHGLEGRFVIMYSGNISLVHPVRTALEAAEKLAGEERLVFLFVGGGLGMESVEAFVRENGLRNVRTLPYQPLDRLRYSLSAADVHLVSMGHDMVGIVHPCKVYGAMAVGRPVLFLGPEESHIGDIIREFDIGWRIDHGDVEGATATIRGLLDTAPEELREMGRRGAAAVENRFGKTLLCNRFCDAIEGRRA